jgi:AraC family transcriptional regulator of adaptative response / DNA-3-methyladenine glycosylase II
VTRDGLTDDGVNRDGVTGEGDGGVVVVVHLAFWAPLWPDSLFGHLAATAVPGVEEWRDGAYRRTLRLPHGPGIVALRPPDGPDGRDGPAGPDAGTAERRAPTAPTAPADPGDAGDAGGPGEAGSSGPCTGRAPRRAVGHVRAVVRADHRDLDAAVARCRSLLDLDADPAVIDGALAADPVLAGLVAAAPGRRVPRTVDVGEMAVRAVLGQQVSTAAARTHAGRLAAAHGLPVRDPSGGLTRLFPEMDALTEVDPATLALPHARRRTLLGLVRALAEGRVDFDGDIDRARATLLALPGMGPWTVDTIAMRALGDTDAWLPTDLGIRVAADRLGLPVTPVALTRRAEAWRPWRAYAVQHLWATGDHAVNRLPGAPAGRP